MAIQLQCEKCGVRHKAWEEHRCVAPDRLERARAVLSKASERVGVKDGRVLKSEEVLAAPDLPSPTVLAAIMRRPRSASSAIDPEKGFDRAAYQKAYMKTYMRGWRARKKATRSEHA